MGLGSPALGPECHVGDLFWVQQELKRMVECGSWLLQVIPQVKIVFGRKSLDDVIPGSWYIIPLPSTREVRFRMLFRWEFHLCEVLGANDCLLDVLSAFEANFVVAEIGIVSACVSWVRLRGHSEDPHVFEDWMRTPRGFQPPDSFCKSGGFWAVKICVLVSLFLLNSAKVNGAFLL